MNINEIESLQNESGLFNLDDIQTLFYEVSYYQDINEENIEKEKESKKESNSYAAAFNEYNRILPGYATSIRNLEEELAKINDKQQHLGGRISEKDKARKNLLLEQIEDLKKKYQEDKVNREEARKGYKEAKELNEQAKNTNEEAQAKQQIKYFQNKIVSIYKYCLSKNKEISEKLAVMDYLLKNETNMERKGKYFLECSKLCSVETTNIIRNYSSVIDKIKDSEVYEDIKPLIEEAELEVQNQQLEGFYDEEVRQLQSGETFVEEAATVAPEPLANLDELVLDKVQNEVVEEQQEQPTITMPDFSFDTQIPEVVQNEEEAEPIVADEVKQEEVVAPVEPQPENLVNEHEVENKETPAVEEPKEEIKSNKVKSKKKRSLLGLFSLKNDEETMINEEPVDGIITNEEKPEEVLQPIEQPTITMPDFSFDTPVPEEVQNDVTEEQQEQPTITMPDFSFDTPVPEEVQNEVTEEQQEQPTITMPDFSFDTPVSEKAQNKLEEDNFMNPFDNFNYNNGKEDEILNSEVKPEAVLGEDEWTNTQEELNNDEMPNQTTIEENSSVDALDRINSIYNSIDDDTNIDENESVAITDIKDASNEVADNAKTKFQKMWFGDNYDSLKEQGKIR